MITDDSFLKSDAPFTSGFKLAKDPLGPLAQEEFRRIPSEDDDKRTYKVMRRKNYYQCSCPSFIYQYETPWEHRTCKHIISIRGEQAEDKRVLAAKIETYGPTGEKPGVAMLPLPSYVEARLGPLKPEESCHVQLCDAGGWTVMRRKDYYECTCPAFKYQKDLTWECRTCKHIQHLRGAIAEKERTDAAKIQRGLIPAYMGMKVRRVKKIKVESGVETVERPKAKSKGTAKIPVKKKLKKKSSMKRASVKKEPKKSSMKRASVKKEPKKSSMKRASVKKEPKKSSMKSASVKKEPKKSSMKSASVKKESKRKSVKKKISVKKESQ